MTTFLLGVSVLVLVGWIFLLWQFYLGSQSVVRLADLPVAKDGLPAVSIIFSARDEEKNIEAACRSLLALDYPDFEVIAVNDRSSDATGRILDRLTAETSRLKVLHVDSLPEGWLGKTNGLQRGLEHARGRYILFTDADVHFEESALRRVLPFVAKHDIDHLAAIPRVKNANGFLRCMLPSFSLSLFMTMRPHSINSDKGKDAIGIGAFNLVRASALRAVGGLEKIRLRPDEDTKLGKILRDAGYRGRFADGSTLMEVEWYQTAREAISGLEKNSFAFLQYSVPGVFAILLLAVPSFILPWFAVLFLPGALFWINLGSLLIFTALHSLTAHNMRIGWYWGLLNLVGVGLILYAITNSMTKTLSRGGVVWRGTLYPLGELRRNKV